jgi:glycosyltransferase involved in cell wall biosynthesis
VSDVGRRSTAGRVLTVTTVPATIDTFLLPHVAALRSAGWDVVLASSGEATSRMRQAGLPFASVPLSRHPANLKAHVLALHRLRRLVKDWRVDAIYVHTPIAAAVVRVAVATLSAGRRPAVVYFAHGFHFLDRAQRDLAQRVWYVVERVLSRWTDQLLVINDVDLHSVESWPLARRGHVRKLGGVGFEPSEFDPAQDVPGPGDRPGRAPNSVASGSPTILCVAEFTANKRQEILVEALELLPEATLVLAGDGPTRRAVQELARVRGVADRVMFTGHVSDVRPLLAEADVMALVSRREGLPRSIMEALCMGVPVAVTETRGSADLARAVGCPVAKDSSPVAVKDAILAASRDERSRSELRADFLAAWNEGLQERVNCQVLEVFAVAGEMSGRPQC